jgi:PAS domain S-box-containing protein
MAGPEPSPEFSRSVRSNLAAGTLVVALFAVAGGLVVAAGSPTGPEAVHAQVEFFAVFTGVSLFFLAAAKYVISRERLYLPLAVGALASSVLDLLEPAVGALPRLVVPGSLPVSPDASEYVWLVSRLAFGAGLLAAAYAYRKGGLDDRPGRRLAVVSVSVLLAAIAFSVLAVVAAPAPLYDYRAGPVALLPAVPLVLYLWAAFLLARATRTSEHGVRAVGLVSLALAVIVQALEMVTRAPFDQPYFAAHVVKVASYLVILFGLYIEHVRLYSLERGMRESIESAHMDLKSAKTELDAIIEDLTDGVMVMDEAGRVVRFNRAAREIMGREGLGIQPEAETQSRVWTPDGKPLSPDQFPIVRALRQGEPVRGVELVVERPTGERRHLVAGAIPLRDARGRIRGAAAAFNDVTEIRAAEQRFRDLTESAPDAVIVVDERWRIILFNRAAEGLLGYGREEVFGRDVVHIIPERLRDNLLKIREEVERTGRPPVLDRPISLRGLRKDGTEVPVDVSLSASGSPRPQFFIAYVRDATGPERMRREREGLLSVAHASSVTVTIDDFLQRAAQSILQATEFNACTVYLHDPARHALELRGHAGIPEDVRGQIQSYALDPKFSAIAVQTWHRRRVLTETHLEGLADYHVTPALLAKYGFGSLISAPFGDEREPWGVLQVVATPGRNPREDDLQLMELLAQELAIGLRQKRLIQQLEQSSTELRQANEELDSFIYTASHDLAEPLRSISNFSHFLLEDYAARLDDEGRDYLQRVHAGSLRMKRLLDDLLRLSRHGRSKTPKIRVNVNDVLHEVRESLDATLRERGAELVVPERIPDVAADRTSLIEVFTNLIGNAIKFNQAERPRVEVGAERRDGFVEFQIRDNGIGIPAEHHQRIFGLFTRLHTRKEYPGTGAGLAIVKKIVENHGGRVWVDSQLDRGSTFYFTIPAAPAPVPKLEVAQARPAGA